MCGRYGVSQYEVISQLRFPLIVLVTYAHSYGAVSADYSLLSSEWDAYEVLKLTVSQTLTKVVVPVFYIISGYLFFANVGRWDVRAYRGKLLRRARTLLLPYVLWNVLMAVKLGATGWGVLWVFWRSAGVQTDWTGGVQLMTAPANMPLWFLRDLMVVSVLSPLVYVAVRRLGWWLLALLGGYYLSGVCAFVPGVSACSVFFFTLGAFLSIRGYDLVVAMRRVAVPAYVLAVLLAAGMVLTYGQAVFSSLMLGFRLSGAVVVFCVAARVLGATRRRLPLVVCRSAYFVYLAHYVFFMSFVDSALFGLMGTGTVALCVHYVAAPLLKAAILLLCYVAWKKVGERFAVR